MHHLPLPVLPAASTCPQERVPGWKLESTRLWSALVSLGTSGPSECAVHLGDESRVPATLCRVPWHTLLPLQGVSRLALLQFGPAPQGGRRCLAACPACLLAGRGLAKALGCPAVPDSGQAWEIAAREGEASLGRELNCRS